ncbi:MAG: hypothetical protein JWO42_119 [Chloroflexi bacterium]|nr:hypothetical protein [Chloroflexota bacterium]
MSGIRPAGSVYSPAGAFHTQFGRPVHAAVHACCNFCDLPDSHARQMIHVQTGNSWVAWTKVCQDIIDLHEIRPICHAVIPRARPIGAGPKGARLARLGVNLCQVLRHVPNTDPSRPNSNKKGAVSDPTFSGTPVATRTPNLQIRNLMLYPLSYGCVLVLT